MPGRAQVRSRRVERAPARWSYDTYNSHLFKIGPDGGAGFWIGVAALLAILGAVQVTSVLDESATFDEPGYVAAGYSYLKTGDFRMNPEHPPLAKVLIALPLL